MFIKLRKKCFSLDEIQAIEPIEYDCKLKGKGYIIFIYYKNRPEPYEVNYGKDQEYYERDLQFIMEKLGVCLGSYNIKG